MNLDSNELHAKFPDSNAALWTVSYMSTKSMM